MNLNDWKSRGIYFKHKGHQIFYREEGQGEALILIHGFPTASWDWHKVWDGLLQRFHLIAPDMIGFGYSDKPKSKHAYSIMDQADLHEKLIDKLGIGKYHILAHDYGDTVAQELLARHEDREKLGDNPYPIASICFLNGGLFPEMHRPRLIQKLLLSPIGFLLNPFLTKEKLRSNFSAIFGPNTQASDQEIDEFYDLIIHNNGKGIMHKLIHYITDRKTNRARWVGALQTSKVPMKVIDGGFDPVSGKHMVDLYKKLVPQPDVTLFDKIGHYPQTEAPDLVLKAYFDFLDRHAL